MISLHSVVFNLTTITTIIGRFQTKVPVLCTLEDARGLIAENDPLEIALNLLKREDFEVEVNRTFIQSEDEFELIAQQTYAAVGALTNADFFHMFQREQKEEQSASYSDIQWEKCSAFLVRSQCGVASVLIDWLRRFKPNKWEPFIIVYEPRLLPCRISTSSVLQLAGSHERMRAVVQFLLHGQLNWQEVILIHDSAIASVRLANLRLAMSQYSILVQVLEMEMLQRDGNLTRGLLAALNADTEHHIILSLGEPQLFEVLHQAKVLNLLQPHHYWVLLSAASCSEALAETVPAESNVLLVMMTHLLQRDMSQSMCGGHMLNDATNSTMRMSHLLAAGIYAALETHRYSGSNTKMVSLCDTPQTFLTGSIDRTQDQLSLWTADGNVTFDLTSGLLTSAGFQVCSTDRFSEKNYTQVARWSNLSGRQATQGPLFRNLFRDFSKNTEKLIVSTREVSKVNLCL
ncbi:hypothetical protein ElyMa_002030800 [Elysia marginata]|uniref:Receptor ligand binding region domain-containing protein n=1 Tax=Elysia marginata TaxID=1093978 RepID=A0AAV4F6J2_9GAST|nr:hypothetical protein ElyMa_002030800 [Elysia marginata]